VADEVVKVLAKASDRKRELIFTDRLGKHKINTYRSHSYYYPFDIPEGIWIVGVLVLHFKKGREVA
jgi:hypothetical protein